MKHARLVGGLLAVGVAVTAASCGDDDSDGSASTDAPNTDAPNTSSGSSEPRGSVADDDDGAGCTEERVGGEITLGMFGELAAFDPVAAAAAGPSGGVELAAVFDTLMRWNPDTAEYEPRVAESLEPNDDSSEWTLTLRYGVQFGDGSPLTTEAVRFNVERHQDPQNNSRALALSQMITGMDIVDDLTMVFHLDAPWTQFPYLLGNEPGMIVNPTALEAEGDEFGAMPTGGGVGPYEVVRFAPGEEIIMEAKDDYWRGIVCIEQLRFIPIPNGNAAYDTFRNDEIDVAFVREPRVAAKVHEDGLPSFSETDSGGNVLLINNGVGDTEPPTADVRLRQAIVHAIDVDVLNERDHEGAALPTSAVIHENSRYYQGLEGPTYDPDRARALVEEVKAEGDWDGRIQLLCGSTPAATQTALSLQAMLADAGFEVEVETPPLSTVIQRIIVESNYELACWGLGIREANAWVTLFNNLHSESGSNWIGYGDPDMDRALDAMRAAATPDEELAALADVQDVWNDTAPLAILDATENITFWRDELEHIEFTQNWMAYFDTAYLDE